MIGGGENQIDGDQVSGCVVDATLTRTERREKMAKSKYGKKATKLIDAGEKLVEAGRKLLEAILDLKVTGGKDGER